MGTPRGALSTASTSVPTVDMAADMVSSHHVRVGHGLGLGSFRRHSDMRTLGLFGVPSTASISVLAINISDVMHMYLVGDLPP
jgi:hypothetical protein